MAVPGTTSITLRIQGGTPLVIQGNTGCAGAINIPLFDDGTHGDLQAADGVFTVDDIRWDASRPPFCNAGLASFPSASPLPPGVRHLSVGDLTFSRGSTPTTFPSFSYSLYILDASQFQVIDPVVRLAPEIQVGPYVVNIIDNDYRVGNYLGQRSGATDLAPLSRKLYGALPDIYDFLTVTSTDQFICTGSRAVGRHESVKVNWAGTGQSLLDLTAFYGSLGRLLGINAIEAQSYYSAQLIDHETSHHWGAYLSLLLGLSDGAHWLPNTSIGGTLGGCVWNDNGNGTFTSGGTWANNQRLGDLELYLMGLIPAEKVKPIYVATNSNQQFCTPGTTLAGPFKQVTVSDIQNAQGKRIPGPETSQKDFRMAYVVTSYNRLLTPLEMAFYSRVGHFIEGTLADNPFAFSRVTENRASMRTDIQALGGRCAASLSPIDQSFNSTGGTGSVNVTMPSDCSWATRSSAPWITITSDMNATGNGAVNYSVEANTSTDPRAGAITINEQTFSIKQNGMHCAGAISPVSATSPAGGAAGSLMVPALPTCGWTATSNTPWIMITSGTSGSGNGTVNYSVAANTDNGPRTGTMTIAGQFFTVAQSNQLTSVSAASFRRMELAAESIVAAFGTALATSTDAATTVPLPTMLAGTTVKVKDGVGAERLAPLFFVSPTQINFQIPPGTTNGTASVTVTSVDGKVSTGTVQIIRAAPGLFSANADGEGLAAALVLRRRPGEPDNFEMVAQFDPSQNKFVEAPIDLGPESDQVFLILFGTGIRFRSSLSAVAGSIGGIVSTALFAGTQGGFVGLDQVNLLVPRSLIGQGNVDIALAVDGKVSNNVRINIK